MLTNLFAVITYYSLIHYGTQCTGETYMYTKGFHTMSTDALQSRILSFLLTCEKYVALTHYQMTKF